jgi:hypothetical protein
MFEKKLIIRGARASRPYGFPLGYELRDEVLKLRDFNYYYNKTPGLECQDDVRFDTFKRELAPSGHPIQSI